MCATNTRRVRSDFNRCGGVLRSSSSVSTWWASSCRLWWAPGGATSGIVDLADVLGGGLTAAIATFGDVAMLVGVVVTTMALTGIISNNAAAVLMFPIAIAAAAGAGLEPRPLAIAVAVGASCEFLTPIGYQTNTMVYGMGGYRFGDFARLGLPFSILTVVVAAVAIPLGWPLR